MKKYSNWHDRFIKARFKRWHAHRIVGAAKPASHLIRPTRRQIMASAKRFVRDGELHNAVEMIRLAYYPEQLTIFFRTKQ